MRRFRFRSRRTLAGIALAAAALVVLWAQESLRPPLSADWRPIFRGIEYRCDRIGPGSDRVTALRIDLEDPTVRIELRPVDPALAAEDRHYRLAIPDWERVRHGYDILLNTVLYEPGEIWRAIPGLPVRALETVVVDGRPTHLDPHSYLFWSGREGRLHASRTKPPHPDQWRNARWGLGLQATQVVEGKVHMGALGDVSKSSRHGRTAIGHDQSGRRLFLVAAEGATSWELADTMAAWGVFLGGELDGGSSTWVLFGSRAAGLLAGAGIRGGRPLGPYLGIRAQPIP